MPRKKMRSLFEARLFAKDVVLHEQALDQAMVNEQLNLGRETGLTAAIPHYKALDRSQTCSFLGSRLDMVQKLHNILPQKIWLLKCSKMSSLLTQKESLLSALEDYTPCSSKCTWQGRKIEKGEVEDSPYHGSERRKFSQWPRPNSWAVRQSRRGNVKTQRVS